MHVSLPQYRIRREVDATVRVGHDLATEPMLEGDGTVWKHKLLGAAIAAARRNQEVESSGAELAGLVAVHALEYPFAQAFIH